MYDDGGPPATGAGGRIAIAADAGPDAAPDAVPDVRPDAGACFRTDAPALAFAPAVRCLPANPPDALVVADLNRDGALDLVLSDFSGGTAVVMLGGGDGTFGAGRAFATGGSPFNLLLRDFDRDGNLDLVTTNLSPDPPDYDGVTILLGRGDGSFSPPRGLLSFSPENLLAGDFDGDGTLDLLADGRLVLGKGDGTFRGRIDVPVAPASNYGFVTTDWNGDGALDIVTMDGAGMLSFLLGDGTGAFTVASEHVPLLTPAQGGTLGILTGDFDCDGHPDIAATDHLGNVAVLRGSGREPPFGSSASAGGLAIADFNGDGRLDVAAAQFSFRSGAYTVAVGTGDGTSFRVETGTFALGRDSTFAGAGDFDGDGRPDLAVINEEGFVSILMNRTGLPGNTDGGALTAGACGPRAPGGVNPITELASDIQDPYGVALDATNVYVTEFAYPDTGHGAVLRIPIAGGSPVALAMDQANPWAIAVDADHVHWTNYDGSIMTMPAGGGAPIELAAASGAAFGIALANSRVLTALIAVPVAGGAPTTLAENLGGARGVASDGRNVYLVQDGGAVGAGSVTAIELAGGASRTIASGLEAPTQIVTDGSHVYWVNTSYTRGSLLRAPTSGGAAIEIAWGQLEPTGIAVDDTHVYWTNRASGQVLMMAK